MNTFRKTILVISILSLTSPLVFADTASPQGDGEMCNTPIAVPSAGAVGQPVIVTPAGFPPYLKNLANAKSVVLGAVGAAGTCDEQCKAYVEAIRQKSTIHKELQWILKNGSPAGKLFSAILIKKFDKTAGTQALEALQSEPEVIYFSMGGCVRGEKKTLGEHALWILKNPGVL